MKKIIIIKQYLYLSPFSILVILGLILIAFSCSKDSPDIVSNHTSKQLNLRDEIPIDLSLSNNWEDGTYLIFDTKEEIKSEYETLKSNLQTAANSTNTRTDNSFLDNWEIERGFLSMRTAYYLYEEDMLKAGFAPEQIKGIPIIDDALASLISVDGLVQVGDEIQYFSPTIYAKAPLQQKSRLKQILMEGEPVSPDDIENGIEITFRSDPVCKADFSININHATFEVFVTYTGSPIGGGDKQIVWSIDGSDYKNQTSFTHKFGSAGRKTICVTYTETDVVKDTTYYYSVKRIDSTYTKADGTDTKVTVLHTTKHISVSTIKKVVCMDTQCKDINIGGCTADFDFTIGTDNVVNFTDKSSVAHGTITGWYWTFGDGATSTERNPTHAYDCDKIYEVTLIIYSAQCPGGQASTSRKIKASGAQCCDRNPESPWKQQEHPTDPENKRIKYRYDMGTNWDWLLDQDFKAKIKYYEHRTGCCWPFNGARWRKTKGLLDVDFDGNVFARDEEECKCKEPRVLTATPIDIRAKSHTFIDHLSASQFGTKKTHWMKRESPVFIDYKVDGVLYLRQLCNTSPGFHCE